MFTECEEDLDFLQSDVDMASKKVDILYDHNVLDGIEIGPNMNDVGHEWEVMLVGELEDDNTVDNLEHPSSKELLLDCSLDEEVGYHFSKFWAEIDMGNP